MSYKKGFNNGYRDGFKDAYKMVMGKFVHSIEFAGAIRSKQLKMINSDLEEMRLSHKTPKPKCTYSKAWVGGCKSEKILDNGQCEDHQGKCSCGNLATHDCAHAGQFVCGRPLCDECSCKH